MCEKRTMKSRTANLLLLVIGATTILIIPLKLKIGSTQKHCSEPTMPRSPIPNSATLTPNSSLNIDLLPRWCNSNHPITRDSDKKKRLPNAIIIGAKKCGTSPLLEMLLSHPFVDGSPTELYFFFRVRYAKGWQWYLDHLPRTRQDQITIEKTPGYFTSQYAMEKLYAMHTSNHSVKFLLILCDPVKRSVSDYAWRIDYKGRKKGKTVLSYEDYVFTDHKELGQPQNVSLRSSEIRVSLYDMHYMRWVEQFGREQIHIINGDELLHNPVPELRKVETFLNIPHYFSDEIFSFNATKGFYCWKRFNTEYECTEPHAKCMGKTNGRKHPVISPQTLQKVKAFLSPHIQKFCRLIPPEVTFTWCF